jgi:hypothetical protein
LCRTMAPRSCGWSGVDGACPGGGTSSLISRTGRAIRRCWPSRRRPRGRAGRRAPGRTWPRVYLIHGSRRSGPARGLGSCGPGATLPLASRSNARRIRRACRRGPSCRSASQLPLVESRLRLGLLRVKSRGAVEHPLRYVPHAVLDHPETHDARSKPDGADHILLLDGDAPDLLP